MSATAVDKPDRNDPRGRIPGADIARFRDHALALADESRRRLHEAALYFIYI